MNSELKKGDILTQKHAERYVETGIIYGDKTCWATEIKDNERHKFGMLDEKGKKQ